MQVTAEEAGGDACLVLGWPVNPEATGIRHAVEASEDLQTWTETAEVKTEGKSSSHFPGCRAHERGKSPAEIPAPENFP